MPSTDDRIVAMKFDNRSFEEKVAGTIDSLDKLKKSLDFSNASKGFSQLNAASRTVSLEGIGRAVEDVKNKFSVMNAVAFSVIGNITSRAFAAGQSLSSSLSLDQVLTGFSEYEKNINSVQTILANTQSKGTSLQNVTDALDELNRYSDQTIYNFGEMAKNVGTFTTAGVGLDESVASIKGFSNVAALSGVDAQTAAGAMYQLSQAMSAGQVRLQDWISIEKSGAGSETFRKALFETGKSLKTLKGVDLNTTYEEWTKGGNSFRGSLEKGWLTTEVMTTTLQGFTGDLTLAQLTALGYTEEQAKQMQQFGKTAKESATVVKTLSQLLGTVRESVGSGWAESFRTIFGNFEQAKQVFSAWNTGIGILVSANADARNNILADWERLGGRTAIIESINQTFKNLLLVFRPVRDAFREIFPRKTGTDLAILSKNLYNFLKRLEPSAKTVETVKRVFKGLFAALEIGFTIFKAVFKVFKGLMSVFAGVGGSPIIGFIAGIADGVVALNKTLVDGGGIDSFVQKILLSFGKLQGILTTFISWFKIGLNGASSAAASSGNAIVKIAFKIGSAFNKIKEFDFSRLLIPLEALWSGLKVVGKALGPALVSIGSGLLFIAKAVGRLASGALGKITGLFKESSDSIETFDKKVKAIQAKGGMKGFSKSLDNVSTALVRLKSGFKAGGNPAKSMKDLGNSGKEASSGLNGFQKFLSAIGSVFKSIGKKIGEIFSKISLGDILLSLLTGGFIGTLNAVRKFVEDLSGLIRGVGKVLNNVADSIKEFSGVLEAVQTNIKAGALTKIAIAIAILAGSLILLSFVDTMKLAAGVGAIGLSLLFLTKTLDALGELTKKNIDTKKLIAFSVSLSVIAASLVILAKAIQMLGGMDPLQLLQGVGAVGTLMAMLAEAMKLFVKAFTEMGDLKVSKMVIALIGVSAALNRLAKVVKIFGDMDPEKMGWGLVGVGASLGILVAAVKLLPDDLQKKTKGMFTFSLALLVMAKAVEMFGKMKPEVASQGLRMFVGVLAAVTSALVILSVAGGEMAGLGMALLGLSVGMLAIAAALKIIGMIDPAQLAIGLGTLTVVLGLLVGSMMLLDAALPGAQALAIAAASFLLLAIAMQQFSSVNIADIGKGLLAMAGVIVILGAAAAALVAFPVLIPALYALGGALLLIGAGFALMGLGARLAADAFAILSSAGGTGLELFQQFLSSIINAIPDFLRGIADGLVSLSETLVQIAPTLVRAFVKIVIGLLVGLREAIPELARTVGELITAFLNLLADRGPDIINAGFTLLLNFLSGLENNVSKIVDVVVGIVSAFLLELANRAVEIVDGGLKVLTAFLLGISDNIGQVITAGTSIIVNLLNGIANSAVEITTAAIGILTSFVTAIGLNISMLVTAGGTMVTAILDAMVGATVTIGRRIADLLTAFGTAVTDNIQLAADTGVSIVVALLDAMANATIEIADGLFNFMTSLLDGLADVIDKRLPELLASGARLAGSLIDGLTGGIIGGIVDVGGAIGDMAQAMLDSFIDFFDIFSPSKLMRKTAEYLPAGIVQAFDRDTSAVNSVKALGGRISDGFSNSLTTLAKIPPLDAIADINPTITPVLDLTNVQRDAASVGAMFGTNSISAKLSTDQANALAAAKVGQPTQTDTPTQVMKEVKFEQNIYSPTTLSTSQIYRQTRSQITLAKERLGLQ